MNHIDVTPTQREHLWESVADVLGLTLCSLSSVSDDYEVMGEVCSAMISNVYRALRLHDSVPVSPGEFFAAVQQYSAEIYMTLKADESCDNSATPSQ